MRLIVRYDEPPAPSEGSETRDRTAPTSSGEVTDTATAVTGDTGGEVDVPCLGPALCLELELFLQWELLQ